MKWSRAYIVESTLQMRASFVRTVERSSSTVSEKYIKLKFINLCAYVLFVCICEIYLHKYKFPLWLINKWICRNLYRINSSFNSRLHLLSIQGMVCTGACREVSDWGGGINSKNLAPFLLGPHPSKKSPEKQNIFQKILAREGGWRFFENKLSTTIFQKIP
jgi:hypothetical protein